MEQRMTLRDIPRITEMVDRAVTAVVNGDVDPLQAHIGISRMERAIELYKKNEQVRDITLRELSKYGRSHRFGDCLLEESEAGVRYDFSVCSDPVYADMLATRSALDADIKDRERYLKSLPSGGITEVNESTGEVLRLHPPVRTSRTIVKTTFKRQ